MSENTIEIQSLTCRFKRKVAVDQLDLSVKQGRIFGLLGENGAGKTTTIRTLMGLLKPTSGQVRVLNQDPIEAGPPLLQKIGYVSDDRSMYRWMTVAEMLWFHSGLYQNWDADYAKQLKKDFELESRQKIGKLSRGQLAKLALLCALAHHPDVLILDEASSGLDPMVRRQLMETLIQTSYERKTTIFLSSHLVEEVDRMADDIAILCQGKLLIQGEKDQVRGSVRKLVISDSQSFDTNSLRDQGILLSQKQIGKETHVILKSDENMEALFQKMGLSKVDFHDLSLEDVFAAYTESAKKREAA